MERNSSGIGRNWQPRGKRMDLYESKLVGKVACHHLHSLTALRTGGLAASDRARPASALSS